MLEQVDIPWRKLQPVMRAHAGIEENCDEKVAAPQTPFGTPTRLCCEGGEVGKEVELGKKEERKFLV